jgi:phosphotriesterase-related protein
MPRDQDRAEALAQLDAWGLLPRVLVSHDVCMKSLWRRYGGYGYTNLLDRVRPTMTAVGLADEAQRQLCLINPSRVFAFSH